MFSKKYFILFILATGMMTLSGCASVNYGTVINKNIVTIDRQHSRTADIGQVTIYKQKKGYLVKGKVRRNIFARGHILGHIDLELINANNKVIFKDNIGYQHHGIRFNHEDFSFIINKNIEKGSRLRITHIESASHKE